MALRFMDSFDHYAAADLLEKWTSVSGTAPTLSAGNGRRSTAALSASATSRFAKKTLTAKSTWTIGFALKVRGTIDTAGYLVYLGDAGSDQCGIFLNLDGTMSFRRGTTTLGTTAFAISSGSYYFVEIKVVIDNTTGTYEIKVDGSSKLSGTGADTQNTANATANEFMLNGRPSASSGGVGTGTDVLFDDLYVCDGDGSTNNNFLGDVRIDSLFPNGAGNSAQFTRGGTDSGANWSQVDENPSNEDTDYCESSTVGNKDTHTFVNMSHTPSSIFGVQVLAHAKKDDAGARSIATVTRSGTIESDGATQALSTSYLYYMDLKEQDPNTSAAWTKSGVDAAEFGIKVAA